MNKQIILAEIKINLKKLSRKARKYMVIGKKNFHLVCKQQTRYCKGKEISNLEGKLIIFAQNVIEQIKKGENTEQSI